MFLKVVENEARNARPNRSRRGAFERSHLEVRMFNVGKGEAVLIVFEDRRAWLVDCGSSNGVNRNRDLGERLVGYLADHDLRLEVIVPSHPHIDHAGSIETILASRSRQIASPLTIYRTNDSTWESSAGWRGRYRNAITARRRRGQTVVETRLRNAHREVHISADVEAHLFVGSGQGAYTSLFVQLRYRDARLLFTGDAECPYEIDLLTAFGLEDFRADVLKVTHHGSSSGTARQVVEAIRPGIAIASTASDGGHRLERDTLDRLGGRPGPRRVFETHVDGDIILRTDGKPFQNGLLYQVEFDTPGQFAADLSADVRSLARVDRDRTVSSHPACR